MRAVSCPRGRKDGVDEEGDAEPAGSAGGRAALQGWAGLPGGFVLLSCQCPAKPRPSRAQQTFTEELATAAVVWQRWDVGGHPPKGRMRSPRPLTRVSLTSASSIICWLPRSYYFHPRPFAVTLQNKAAGASRLQRAQQRQQDFICEVLGLGRIRLLLLMYLSPVLWSHSPTQC